MIEYTAKDSSELARLLVYSSTQNGQIGGSYLVFNGTDNYIVDVRRTAKDVKHNDV